jgi:hypothetical protein
MPETDQEHAVPALDDYRRLTRQALTEWEEHRWQSQGYVPFGSTVTADGYAIPPVAGPGSAYDRMSTTPTPTTVRLEGEAARPVLDNPMCDLLALVPVPRTVRTGLDGTSGGTWLNAAYRWWHGDNQVPGLPAFDCDRSGLKFIQDPMLFRARLVSRFAWSIPTRGDIHWIAGHLAGRHLVEMGAGSGYWAWQLRQYGIDVAAYDQDPPGSATGWRNRWCPSNESWTGVRRGTPGTLQRHQDRALLLCWPPYNTDFAYRVLATYAGDMVFYAGEGWGGCTGTDRFYDLLEKDWDLVESSPHHWTWQFIRCDLRLYRRKSNRPPA